MKYTFLGPRNKTTTLDIQYKNIPFKVVLVQYAYTAVYKEAYLLFNSIKYIGTDVFEYTVCKHSWSLQDI